MSRLTKNLQHMTPKVTVLTTVGIVLLLAFVLTNSVYAGGGVGGGGDEESGESGLARRLGVER